MKKANKFYKWFAKLGGETTNYHDSEGVLRKLNMPTFLISSLKQRPEEIKEKYNHKFN
jgi:hypothetical protein